MIYIVVLNWNGAEDTIACAESVFALDGVPFRLVICDNSSTDDSVAMLNRWASGLTRGSQQTSALITLSNDPNSWTREVHPEGSVVLIQTGANLGYAGGNNVGIRYAMSQGDVDYVWVLNNDTTVTPRALRTLIAKAERDPDYGIIGSTLLYFYRPQHVQVLAGCRFSAWTTQIAPLGEGQLAVDVATSLEAEAAVEAQLDYVTGAAMLIRKAFIEDVGLMAEDYFLYCEEIDWAERGRRSPNRRWRLGFASDSLVLHKVGASAETGVSTSATMFFYTSKLRYMKRFYPARYPWIVLMIALQGVKKFIKNNPNQARAIFRALKQFDSTSPTVAGSKFYT
jgi:GT2 family glycosyltransferase